MFASRLSESFPESLAQRLQSRQPQEPEGGDGRHSQWHSEILWKPGWFRGSVNIGKNIILEDWLVHGDGRTGAILLTAAFWKKSMPCKILWPSKISTFLHYRHLGLLHLSQCTRKLTTVMPPGCLAWLASGGRANWGCSLGLSENWVFHQTRPVKWVWLAPLSQAIFPMIAGFWLPFWFHHQCLKRN